MSVNYSLYIVKMSKINVVVIHNRDMSDTANRARKSCGTQSRCITFHVDMSLICKTINVEENLASAYENVFTPRLVLKQRKKQQLGN